MPTPLPDTRLDAEVERLLEERQEARPLALPPRERATEAVLAVLALAVSVGLVALAHPARSFSLPLVAVFGLTIAFVVTSLRPRASVIAGSLVLSGLLALNLVGLMLSLARFYG